MLRQQGIYQGYHFGSSSSQIGPLLWPLFTLHHIDCSILCLLCWIQSRSHGMTSFRHWFCISHGLGGESAAWVAILLLSRPPHILFLFCLVSRKYLTSGWFSWRKLFLVVHSCIFLTCSNSGLANLSCTVKIKHPRHINIKIRPEKLKK